MQRFIVLIGPVQYDAFAASCNECNLKLRKGQGRSQEI